MQVVTGKLVTGLIITVSCVCVCDLFILTLTEFFIDGLPYDLF